MGWDNPPLPWRELERRLSWAGHGAQGGKGGEGGPADNDRAHANEDDRDNDNDGDNGQARPAPRLPTRAPEPPGRDKPGAAWAELHCHSSYSFLDGASSPEDLVTEAAQQGLQALAITDHDGMYGVPQFA